MKIKSSADFALQMFAQAYLTLIVFGEKKHANQLRDIAKSQHGDDPIISDFHEDGGDKAFAAICEMLADAIENN